MPIVQTNERQKNASKQIKCKRRESFIGCVWCLWIVCLFCCLFSLSFRFARARQTTLLFLCIILFSEWLSRARARARSFIPLFARWIECVKSWQEAVNAHDFFLVFIRFCFLNGIISPVAVHSHAIIYTEHCAHIHTPGTVIITAWYTLLCDSGDNNFSRLRSSGTTQSRFVGGEFVRFRFFFCFDRMFALKCCQVQIIRSKLSAFGLFCDVLLMLLLLLYAHTRTAYRTVAVLFLI